MYVNIKEFHEHVRYTIGYIYINLSMFSSALAEKPINPSGSQVGGEGAASPPLNRKLNVLLSLHSPVTTTQERRRRRKIRLTPKKH